MSKKVRKSAPKFKRRAEARPDEVLDAALELFMKKGFAATRVEDIGKRAGISKGLVYQYFASKQALMEGLVIRAISPVTADAMKMVSAYEGDPRALITMMMAMLGSRLNEPHILAIPKLIMREAVAFPEIARMYEERVLRTTMPVLEQLIKKGVVQGYFRQVDPELTIRSIMGPLLAHILLAEVFKIEPQDGLALDRLMENHLSILFDGLCLPPEDTK